MKIDPPPRLIVVCPNKQPRCCKLISGVVGPEGLPPPNTNVSPQAARLLTSEIGPPDSGRPIDLPFRGDERESLFEAAFDKALDDI